MLERETELWRQHERIAGLEREAEKAEAAVKNARVASSAAIENHFANNGGAGLLPGVDSLKQAEMQQHALLARRAANIASARGRWIKPQVDLLAKELEQNRIAIEGHGGNLRKAS